MLPDDEHLLEAGCKIFEMVEALDENSETDFGYVSARLKIDGRTYAVLVLDPELATTIQKIAAMYCMCPSFWRSVEEAIFREVCSHHQGRTQ